MNVDKFRIVLEACLKDSIRELKEARDAVKAAYNEHDGDVDELEPDELQAVEDEIFYRGRVDALYDVLNLLEDSTDE